MTAEQRIDESDLTWLDADDLDHADWVRWQRGLRERRLREYREFIVNYPDGDPLQPRKTRTRWRELLTLRGSTSQR